MGICRSSSRRRVRDPGSDAGGSEYDLAVTLVLCARLNGDTVLRTDMGVRRTLRR